MAVQSDISQRKSAYHDVIGYHQCHWLGSLPWRCASKERLWGRASDRVVVGTLLSCWRKMSTNGGDWTVWNWSSAVHFYHSLTIMSRDRSIRHCECFVELRHIFCLSYSCQLTIQLCLFIFWCWNAFLCLVIVCTATCTYMLIVVFLICTNCLRVAVILDWHVLH